MKEGSLTQDARTLGTAFIIRDKHSEMTTRYIGVLPDLFREGQGVIVEGKLTQENIFLADHVLAKHDETYRPPQ